MKWKVKEKDPKFKKWFAWHPVRIWDNSFTKCNWHWLEYVERRKWFETSDWSLTGDWEKEYRLLND